MPGAFSGEQNKLPFQSDIDMSALQYRIVAPTTTGDYTMTVASAPQSLNLGIVQENPTSQQNAPVCLFGPSKVYVGSTVTAGTRFTSNGSGEARPVVAGSAEYPLGVVLVGANQGELADVWVSPSVIPQA